MAVTPPAADPRGDDQLVGGVAVHDDPLFAVERPASPVPHRSRLDVVQVVARSPLGMGEGEGEAAVRDLRDETRHIGRCCRRGGETRRRARLSQDTVRARARGRRLPSRSSSRPDRLPSRHGAPRTAGRAARVRRIAPTIRGSSPPGSGRNPCAARTRSGHRSAGRGSPSAAAALHSGRSPWFTIPGSPWR